MNDRCLICGADIESGGEYHPRCSQNFFGTYPPPRLEAALSDIKEFAATTVLSRITVTGVQKKLSLGIEKQGKDARLTIAGLRGKFILKPPVEEYPYLPENEDAVMRFASAVGIPVVPHALVRLASGEHAYISKRIDRDAGGKKLAMEDFCQLSERLTEDKYKGSVERIGKLIRRYSAFPGLDAIDLFERVVFNFVCGNSDMDLKNYSLIETHDGMRLAPAYDLVSTMLVIPDDPEESALAINGKKSNLEKNDFDSLGSYLGIPEMVVKKIFKKMVLRRDAVAAIISNSSLVPQQQQMLLGLIDTRIGTFEAAPGDL